MNDEERLPEARRVLALSTEAIVGAADDAVALSLAALGQGHALVSIAESLQGLVRLYRAHLQLTVIGARGATAMLGDELDPELKRVLEEMARAIEEAG